MGDTLLIRYKDGSGNFTERKISDIRREGALAVSAFCHLRNEERTFAVRNILSAIDVDTGLVVEDLYSHFGLPKPYVAPPPLPPVTAPPTERGEALRKIRKQEEVLLWSRFRLAVVENFYKQKFFALFGNHCFKCGAPGPLVIDHHVPLLLGGHLVPGNLVALCRPCNGKKLDQPPENFYTPADLERLAPILAAQADFFRFTFDFDFWKRNPEAYLVQLGLSQEEAHAIFTDQNHRFFMPPPEPEQVIEISITADLILATMQSLSEANAPIRANPVDPQVYFGDWAFEIREPLYPALGVNLRRVVDKEKNAVERKLAIANGMTKNDALVAINFTKLEYAVGSPPQYGFHEGDIFYRPGTSEFVQVIRLMTKDGRTMIEAHTPYGSGSRLAFHVTPEDLARHLKSGTNLSDSSRILSAESLSDPLRCSIYDL